MCIAPHIDSIPNVTKLNIWYISLSLGIILINVGIFGHAIRNESVCVHYVSSVLPGGTSKLIRHWICVLISELMQ